MRNGGPHLIYQARSHVGARRITKRGEISKPVFRSFIASFDVALSQAIDTVGYPAVVDGFFMALHK